MGEAILKELQKLHAQKFLVVAGLVPGIHASCLAQASGKRNGRTSPAMTTSIYRSAQYSGNCLGKPPTSDGVLSGWRSIGRLLFSRANDGYPYGDGNA